MQGKLLKCGLILLIGLFCLLLVNLFLLRFRAGDIYPPYSSLRSDPLGTKALVKALVGVALGHEQRAHGRRVARLARAIEAHDKAHAAEHVLLLPLDAADVA